MAADDTAQLQPTHDSQEGELASYRVIVRRLDAYTRELEAALAAARDALALDAAIFDAVPDPLLAVDRHGILLRANRAAVRLFGLSPDLATTSCTTAVRCARCLGDGCPLMADPGIRQRVMQVADPDGAPTAFAITATPLSPGDGPALLLRFQPLDATCSDSPAGTS